MLAHKTLHKWEFIRSLPFSRVMMMPTNVDWEAIMRSECIYAAVFLLLATPAWAQTPTQTCNRQVHAQREVPSPQLIGARRAMRQACAADENRYCSNVPRACGERAKCMKSHRAQASAGCLTAWRNLRAVRLQTRSGPRATVGPSHNP